MEADPAPRITQLLHAASDGDEAAVDDLFALVYEELRHLARKVRRGRAGHTLNTTALVHEAYLKLVPGRDVAWTNRLHFFRIAARAMRQVLVNAARHRMADKRNAAGFTVSFDEQMHQPAIQAQDVLGLDESLTRLEAFDRRQAQVVECRFFAGLTIEETAQALAISPMTVKRDWQVARAWLARDMNAR